MCRPVRRNPLHDGYIEGKYCLGKGHMRPLGVAQDFVFLGIGIHEVDKIAEGDLFRASLV